MTSVALRPDQAVEAQRILDGSLAPLAGFMSAEEVDSVTTSLRLPSGDLMGVPVVLDVSEDVAERVRHAGSTDLWLGTDRVASLDVRSVFVIDKQAIASQVFGTTDTRHPGVARLGRMGSHAIGGPLQEIARSHLDDPTSPASVRRTIEARGWKTTAGFQTRNIPHRAHEYLHRQALEACDGLLIQPLIGARKAGDFSPDAVMAGYSTLVARHLPPGRVVLSPIRLGMRYAGPREAVFHAIVRRNYGCTHFVVGRDHAGVGSFYAPYDAHALLRGVARDLGIEILYMRGPAHCSICSRIVTDETCEHFQTRPDAIEEVSGTWLRSTMNDGGIVPDHLVRSDVLAALAGLAPFLDDTDAY